MDFNRTVRPRIAISVVTQSWEKADMPRTVADRFAEPLAAAAVERIRGLVGDGLTDAVRRQGKVEWVHVRHGEETVRRRTRPMNLQVRDRDRDALSQLEPSSPQLGQGSSPEPTSNDVPAAEVHRDSISGRGPPAQERPSPEDRVEDRRQKAAIIISSRTANTRPRLGSLRYLRPRPPPRASSPCSLRSPSTSISPIGHCSPFSSSRSRSRVGSSWRRVSIALSGP